LIEGAVAETKSPERREWLALIDTFLKSELRHSRDLPDDQKMAVRQGMRLRGIIVGEIEKYWLVADATVDDRAVEPHINLTHKDQWRLLEPDTLTLTQRLATGVGADREGPAQPKELVDVVICAYGKPYQTAITLASLLQHSGQHIDKIYFQEERQQPFEDEVASVIDCFGEKNFVHYKPQHHIGVEFTDKLRFGDDAYRRSIRYQYAWEESDKRFLFLTHNDCLFTADIVGGMLQRLKDRTYAGVGRVGQCWNCPAYSAGVCDGDRYASYNPVYEEAVRIVEEYPSPRTYKEGIDRHSPMPLPECRLNEFACLINLEMVRNLVSPIGDIEPFGTLTLDIGTDWFRKLNLQGYRFLNWYEGMIHAWCSDGANGLSSDNDYETYCRNETKAKDYLNRYHRAVFDQLSGKRYTSLLRRLSSPRPPQQ
jgi:hypothetical protein